MTLLSSTRRWRARGALLLACAPAVVAALLAAAPTSALAGTVEATVRVRGGEALSKITVELIPVDVVADGRRGVRSRYGWTDREGRARFDVPLTGQFTFRLRGIDDPELVRPEDNPFAPMPVVTLADESDEVAVTIELWRGGTVVGHVQVDRWDVPRAIVTFESPETGQVVEARVSESGSVERTLPAGRWIVRLRVPPGYVITGLEEGGRSLPGHSVTVQVESVIKPVYVTWSVSAGAKVWGRVTYDGPEVPVRVSGTLAVPGTWHEDALARGGSRFDAVHGWTDRNFEYEIVAPDGTWRFAAGGDEVESATPGETELTLYPGDEVRLDFDVTTFEGESSRSLIVTVEAPNRRDVGGALVKIWPGASPGEPDAARKSYTGDRGEVVFRDVEPGTYAIVAGHASYTEAAGDGRVGSGDDESLGFGSVTLEPAARVRVLAVETIDDTDVPVPDVELIAERLEPLPPSLLEDAALDAEKMRRTGTTDDTGRLALSGLHEGAYRLHARLAGSLARKKFVRLYADERLEEAIEIDIAGDRDELDTMLFVFPAASLHGTIVCDDGEPLPVTASFRVFPVERTHTDRREDPDLLDGAVLALDDIPLTGEHADTFQVGPLEADAFHVALRPAGHALWTWVPGSESRSRASIIDTSTGSESGVGLIEAFCGPVIELLPVVPDDAPLPDVRDMRFKITGTITDEAGDVTTIRDPATEALDDRLMIRELPEGHVELTVTAEHPHFLPRPMQTWTVSGETRRGGLEALPLDVPGIGGALTVTSGHRAVAVRKADDDGELVAVTVAVAERNEVTFESLGPGTYVVVPCDDIACTVDAGPTADVTIEAGRTKELDLRE